MNDDPAPSPGMTTCCYCRRCGYDLRASSERCPECGTAFDPSNPRTFRRSPRSHARRRWAKRILIPLTILSLLWGGFVGWLWWGWREEQQALAMMKARAGLTEPLDPRLLYILPRRLEFLADRIDGLGMDGATDADVESLCRLRRLKHLNLYKDEMSDTGVARLSTLTSLEGLALSHPPLTDRGLGHLARLPRLNGLILFDAPRITDAGVARLRGLRRLEHLTLSDIPITDAAVDSLCTLTSLQFLNVGYTCLTDEGVARLEAALPKTVILSDSRSPATQPAPQ